MPLHSPHQFQRRMMESSKVTIKLKQGTDWKEIWWHGQWVFTLFLAYEAAGFSATWNSKGEANLSQSVPLKSEKSSNISCIPLAQETITATSSFQLPCHKNCMLAVLSLDKRLKTPHYNKISSTSTCTSLSEMRTAHSYINTCIKTNKVCLWINSIITTIRV